MGGQESKSHEYEEAAALFSDDEKLKIKELYQRMCRDEERGISLDETKRFVGHILPNALAEHLYLFCKSVIKSDDGHRIKRGITDEELLVALAALMKGTPEQRSLLFTCLACGDEQGTLTIPQIKQASQLIEKLLEAYGRTLSHQSAFNSWKLRNNYTMNQITRSIVHDLVHKDGSLQCDHDETAQSAASSQFEAWNLEPWLSSSALLLHILEHVFYACFPVTFMNLSLTSLVPQIEPVDWQRFHSILDFQALVHLNNSLVPEYQKEWRLLYSSEIHGESFATMTKRIKDKGPTVLIIRDTDGFVFGAHHTQSWELNANFVGSDRCFLFTLFPTMEVYSATSYNTNYAYLNQGQETLPNGLAFGGQFGYHGLWLDYDYGHGHSKAQPKCTTYNSPQLSKQAEFRVDAIEVWAVGPKSQDEIDAAAAAPGSILDKDPTAKAMLTMINKGPHSEGLREQDAKADSPEDHEIGPIGL